MDKEEGFKIGEKVTWIGIWVGIGLTLFEVLAGFSGKSTAVIADASHSAADLFATLVVLLGLKMAKKPYDREHPYGHGKIEYLVAALAGLLLLGVGVGIIFSAIRSLNRGAVPRPEMVALIAALTAILVRESLYQYTMRAGKKLNSPAIIANAWHHRSDALSSIPAALGVFGGMLGFSYLDPLAGAGVSLFIIKMGFDIIVDSYNGLMDTGPGEEVMKQIVKVAKKVKGVEHAYSRARKMGRFTFVDVKLDVDPKTSIEEGHAIGAQVKRRILTDIKQVADVMVHLNPHRD